MENDFNNNEALNRFELEVEGQTAIIDYTMLDGVMHMNHTKVPPTLQGKGVGFTLVRQALEAAREKQLKIAPNCSFVATYIRRHPEWNAHVAGAESN